MLRPEEEYESSLEVELRSKLELTRIVCRGRATEEPSVTRTLSKRIYVSKERRCRAFVETVEQIEYLADDVETQTLAKPECPGHAEVNGSKAVGYTHIASEATG